MDATAQRAPIRSASSTEEHITSQLVDAQYRHSLQASASGLVLAWIVTWVLWHGVPRAALLGWMTLTAGAGLLRVTTTLYYLHGGRRLGTTTWLGITRLGTTLSGIGWGLLGVFYALTDEPLLQLVIVFTLMGVCAGSAALVLSLGRVIQVFGLLALGPLVLTLLLQGDMAHAYLGLGLIYYVWVVMFKGPQRSVTTLLEVLHRGHERELLLGRLEDAERMAHMAHLNWDHHAQRATLSPQARQMIGLEADARIDQTTLLNRIVSHDRSRILGLSCQAIGTRQPELRFETQIETPEGLRDLQVVQRFEYAADHHPGDKPLRTLTTLLDITELKTTQRELHSLAFSDPLTGLANRALFLEELRKAVNHAQRHGQSLSVLILDLDHFKTVNDTLGHTIGDQLLFEAASRVHSNMRAYDTVARLGGDEFAVVVADMRQALDTAAVARKILAVLAEPFRIDGQDLYISASIGIAICPDDALDPDTLLRHADIALFDAKSKGRANFQFYSSELTEHARARMDLETDLRRAPDRHELELHYQPKVQLCDGRLIGAEALLRWQHPVRGMVPPDRFIGLAEDTGLIVPIGAWVIRTAFAAAAGWNHGRAPDDTLKIAVNLSPRQFSGHDLVGTINDALQHTGCRAEWIELELTESLLLDERSQIQDTLAELRQLGFTLAIDDFGTGYSALGYLTRFPITTLKIDRSFINDITTRTDRAAVVRAIVSMGHSLGMELVAEGVETAEQARMLDEMSCRLAQGWHYGRPVPQAQFTQRLQDMATATS